MGRKIADRVDNLERIIIETEGSQFAIRHLLASLLARLDRGEAEECLRELQRVGRANGAGLGDARLAAYLDELDAIRAATIDLEIQPVPPLRAIN